MDPVTLVFLIIAAVLFGIACTRWAAGLAVQLIAGGLLASVLATLLPAIVN